MIVTSVASGDTLILIYKSQDVEELSNADIERVAKDNLEYAIGMLTATSVREQPRLTLTGAGDNTITSP